MVKLFYTAAFLCWSFLASAQVPCQPDPQYNDSLSGVYPLPYIETVRPNGGINRPACIGRDYSFVFTIKVGDSITVNSPLGTLTLPIDSVSMSRTGAVQNLPTGISYACNPPSCVWPKRSGGCVVLRGVADASNIVKVYKLIISGKAYTFLTPTGYDVTFPGAISTGEYNLTLLASNNSACTGVSVTDIAALNSIRISPNPVQDQAMLQVEANQAEKLLLTVQNAVGQVMTQTFVQVEAGDNALVLETATWPNGLYVYSLSHQGAQVSGKFVVQR